MHFNIKSVLANTTYWYQKNTPIYKRLYFSLKHLIIKNAIPYKTKLPPTRLIAKDLSISRSTVVKAFDLLCFDRFIVAKKGSGYFVSYWSKSDNNQVQNLFKSNYPPISKRAKRFQKYQYISTDNFSKENVAFRPGLPPLDIFPVKKWKAISNLYWQGVTSTHLSYAPAEGIGYLRKSIANYLKIYRHIECDYRQIIITSGSLHSLYLLANVLIDKGDEIVMENPTFPRAYNLFKSVRANIISCSIDSEGLNIGEVLSKKIKLIYTTPSSQYPLGIRMSVNRRTELLEFASKRNSLIIEDDYDHEFSNWKNPIPSLFSLDVENRVVYLGTFNKLLHPALRVGYMIAPPYLINPIKAIYEQSNRFIPISTQTILHRFMEKNLLNLHIRNVLNTVAERRALFLKMTKNSLEVSKNNEGLHLIGKLKYPIKDVEAYQLLLKHNVVAYPLSNYYFTKEKKEGLVLGFSSVYKKMIIEKTKVMNKVLGEVNSK